MGECFIVKEPGPPVVMPKSWVFGRAGLRYRLPEMRQAVPGPRLGTACRGRWESPGVPAMLAVGKALPAQLGITGG